MNKKIGVFGHVKRINDIKEVSKAFEDTIDFIFVELNTLPTVAELKKILEEYEPVLNGIIFTGHVLYDMIIGEIIPSIPWEYLHRNDHQLYRALLKIKIKTDYDINRVSIDSYNRSTVKRIYSSLDIDSSIGNIVVAKDMDDNNDNVEYLKSFHLSNYRSGMVSCCITGLGNISDYLESRDIPVFTLDPTYDVIRETLMRLQMKSEVKKNRQSQIVVLYATIDESGDYSIKNDDNYNSAIEHMTVSKNIYKFAQSIGGVVTERNRGYFLIFTTRNLIETITENFRTLPLLDNIEDNALRTISAGIGYGNNVMEAKQNAVNGMLRSKNNGGSQAYVVYNNKVIGPIKPSVNISKTKDLRVDKSFHIIAEETRLSINSIYKLHSIMVSSNKKTFTSKELSELYGVTSRSMNRILDKLIENDYAAVVGERVISNHGRPSRIIQLKITI